MTPPIERFADPAPFSFSYYGMLRGQLHINLPPKHPIMSLVTIEIKMAAVSAKRSIGVDAQKFQNTQFQPIGAFDLQIKTLEFQNIFTIFDGAAEVKFETVF